MNLQSGIIIMHDICRKISRKIIIHVSNYKTGGPIVGCFKRLGHNQRCLKKKVEFTGNRLVCEWNQEPPVRRVCKIRKLRTDHFAYIFNVKGINSRIRTSDVLHHEDPEDHLPVVTKMNPI
jgi:hypothetical protein